MQFGAIDVVLDQWGRDLSAEYAERWLSLLYGDTPKWRVRRIERRRRRRQLRRHARR